MQKLESQWNVMVPIAIINMILKKAEAGTRTRIGRTTTQHANHLATENCWQNEFTTRHMKLQGRTREIKSCIPKKRWSVDT
jgi:hypothetical protein